MDMSQLSHAEIIVILKRNEALKKLNFVGSRGYDDAHRNVVDCRFEITRRFVNALVENRQAA
jgi:hypothetical protein